MRVTLLHYNYMQSVCLHICVCVWGGGGGIQEIGRSLGVHCLCVYCIE